MKRARILLSLFLVAFTLSGYASTREFSIDASGDDSMLDLRKVIDEASKYDDVTINLEAKTYNIKSDLSYEKYLQVTNHENGLKKIAFDLSNHKHLVIDGHGATLMFYGKIIPFLIEDCDKVEIRNLTIDWFHPFNFLAEVVEVDPNNEWRVVKPMREKDGFSWSLKGGKISYPKIDDGYAYEDLGGTLIWDAKTKRPMIGKRDLRSYPTSVETLPNGNLKIYEKLTKTTPVVGSLMNSCGDNSYVRYGPGVEMKECSNITIDNVTIHHSLGMGFLFERSSDISIVNSKVVLPDGSARVCSAKADATHFANCRGEILIENCRFENMMDDGTNVHGTYVEVMEVLNGHSVRVKFGHPQQLGFKFADTKDEIWFIRQPSPDRRETGVVKDVKILNETIFDIEFVGALPGGLKEGDILENKSWNPTFTMRGCTIQNHRARSVILKTPLKVVIEDNYFSSMMSGILFRGETFYWYESGAVEDVLIRNNTFHNGADIGTDHAALYVTPRLGRQFDQKASYDRNIRFVNNKIDCFNPRVVIADRVDGLTIEGNEIIRNEDHYFEDAPIFEFMNCKNINIRGNSYEGKQPVDVMKIDEASSRDIVIKKNKGLQLKLKK